MSRAYSMTVEISGHDPARKEAIQAAAEAEWPFEKDCWTDNGEKMNVFGDGQLCGGEMEEEFTERLSLAVWRANGAFCEVVVDATYMEELPHETHFLNENDYARLLKNKPPQTRGGKAGRRKT
ncbi:MAG: hypothetical protein JXB10_10330 [Pirellulales bacterium]|nr:hypothetical protein [Pirellulales bacterium]